MLLNLSYCFRLSIINRSTRCPFADRHSSATEEEKKEHERKFKEIGEAYGILSDAKKRSRYDNGCDVEDLDGGGHGGYGGDVDPDQVIRSFWFHSGEE